MVYPSITQAPPQTAPSFPTENSSVPQLPLNLLSWETAKKKKKTPDHISGLDKTILDTPLIQCDLIVKLKESNVRNSNLENIIFVS